MSCATFVISMQELLKHCLCLFAVICRYYKINAYKVLGNKISNRNFSGLSDEFFGKAREVAIYKTSAEILLWLNLMHKE